MATLLTHAVVGAALGQAAAWPARGDVRFWCAAVFCSLLPDVDVIGFRLGIPYGDLWGHRGIMHSLLFAALAGVLFGALLGKSALERAKLSLLLFVITASHGFLDAMTDGGLGVAFFSPFDTARYFLPWRPIHVSPIGVHSAFSARIIRVLWSEIRSVWPIALLLGLVLRLVSARQRPLAAA